jgi:hypothetical protein
MVRERAFVVEQVFGSAVVAGMTTRPPTSATAYRPTVTPRTERPAMADYGVPDDLDGALPWSWAEERLTASRNYWVTTVSGQGHPHSMPVWGVWLPDRERFWFSCSPNARKARNIAENDRVVVAPTDTVEVVSLEGRAEDATGGDLEVHVQAYVAKYGEEMGMAADQVEEFLTANASFEVVPDRAFGIIERAEDFSRRATRWRW